MTISELLKDFNQYNAGVDTVEICTLDYDFGSILTTDIVSIDNIMNEAEFVDYRIATVKRWWLNRIMETNIHPNPFNMRIQLVVQI